MTPGHFNGSTLALAGAVVAILLRKRAIGGWFFYFFWQVLLGLGLIATTTRWNMYLSGSWADAGPYLGYLLANLSRALWLVVVGAVWLTLAATREWDWVCGLRYTLAVYGLLTLLKLVVDQAYFPEHTRLDALSLAFPGAWMVYFSVSQRVRRVFRDKTW